MPEKFLTVNAVGETIGFGKSFIYAAMKNNNFPLPVIIGTNVRWLSSDIQKWMAAQPKKNPIKKGTGRTRLKLPR